MAHAFPFLILLILFVLGSFLVWPRIDLAVSGLFFVNGRFPLEHNTFFLAMRDLVFYGARVLGVVLLLMTLAAFVRRRAVAGIDAKGWLFLFLALLLGPGLVANVVFKDHWGRARPREVVEFGGARAFSPALVPQDNGRTNSSFVSGDAAFGFFLPCFAYAVPERRRRLSRRVFWGGMAAGAFFSLCRLVMGAHFLSDILFAMAFMLAGGALLHAVMYGRHATATRWRGWFSCGE